MTVQRAAEIERRMHGVIGLAPRGRRIVGVLTPHRKEIWLVDEHEDVVDVGIVHPVPNGDIVVIRWQGGTPVYSLRTRYPMTIRPTPRRHSAFQMITEIAAFARSVRLDYAAFGTASFVFTDAGAVRSASLAGIWWISEGDIKIDIQGKVETYTWRNFAKAASWIRPHEPATPSFEEHYGD